MKYADPRPQSLTGEGSFLCINKEHPRRGGVGRSVAQILHDYRQVLHRQSTGEVEEREEQCLDDHRDVIVTVVPALLAEVATGDVAHPSLCLADLADGDAQHLLDEERTDGDEDRNYECRDTDERNEHNEHPADGKDEQQRLHEVESQVEMIGPARQGLTVFLNQKDP